MEITFHITTIRKELVHIVNLVLRNIRVNKLNTWTRIQLDIIQVY